MKKSNVLLIPVCLSLLFLAVGIQTAVAQSAKPATASATNAAHVAPTPLPFCDEALPKAKQRLQTEADSKCKTAHACIPCIMRESNTELYATLIVQPKKATCKKLDALKTLAAEGVEEQQVFPFEILQSVCTRSGVSLEVFFPDSRLKPTDFSYEWTIDGKVESREAKLDCGCGKNTTLKVTKNGTKQSSTKAFALPEACSGGTKDKE